MQVKHFRHADYASSYEAMRSFTESRNEATLDELWLCEHPPVFTLGLAGKREHVLDAHDVPIIETNRGGQVTYHGPGQVVAYPLVDLRRCYGGKGIYVKEYVYRLEQAVIQTLAGYGVTGRRVKGAPGIYVATSVSYPHPSPPPLGEGTELMIASRALPQRGMHSNSLPQRGRAGVGAASATVTEPFIPQALPTQLLANARALRSQLTDAEQFLWSLLRKEQLGVKFRRQHPLEPYILDFYCLEAKLAIELDGGQHNEDAARVYDDVRSEALKREGISVLRFWNHEVFQNTEGVLIRIVERIEALLPPPQPSAAGGGGKTATSALHCHAGQPSPLPPSPAGEGWGGGTLPATEHPFQGLAKIAALGIKISRHCAYHGVALNVAMDLKPYSWINPCGYEGLQTVDLATLGIHTTWDEAASRLAERLQAHLS